MEKYINKYGKECWKNVDEETVFDETMFHEIEDMPEQDRQFALFTNLGSLTVLDRMTGFGRRDTETGFRDKDGNFWLASGMFDVRHSGSKTISEAIEWVKKNANTCVPNDLNEPRGNQA